MMFYAGAGLVLTQLRFPLLNKVFSNLLAYLLKYFTLPCFAVLYFDTYIR